MKYALLAAAIYIFASELEYRDQVNIQNSKVIHEHHQ